MIQDCREIVGSLIYAMIATRPDISYVVTKLSQNMSNPTVQDLGVAKGVLVWCKLHKKQHVSAFFGKSVLKCHLT